LRTDAAAVGCARDNRAISATTVTSATMPKDFTATSNSTPVCAEFVEARQMLFNNNNNSNNNPICKAPKCQKTSVALGVALTLLHFTVDVCNGNANSRPLHKFRAGLSIVPVVRWEGPPPPGGPRRSAGNFYVREREFDFMTAES